MYEFKNKATAHKVDTKKSIEYPATVAKHYMERRLYDSVASENEANERLVKIKKLCDKYNYQL